MEEAKSRALFPLTEDLIYSFPPYDRFMNRMTETSNHGAGLAKDFLSDKSIDDATEAQIDQLVEGCNSRSEFFLLELGALNEEESQPVNNPAGNPVFGSPTFFSDAKQWLVDNGVKVLEGSFGHARYAVINADDFDYTTWTTTTTNHNIFHAKGANPDAKVIINGALFNYKKEVFTTTGIVYSDGVKLATSTAPGKASHKVAGLRYWFGQTVDNTPATNAGTAATFKFGGKGHPPVPAAPGPNDVHSATGGLISIIWPDAAGNRKKVTAKMDSDLKVYEGWKGPMYGHGIVAVDRDTGMLIILSKDNGIRKKLSIFAVQDKLWNSGVDQAAGTDGGSAVALSINGAIKVKGKRHFGKSSARDTVTNYMIFSPR